MTEHEEARGRLTSHGDELLRERMLTPKEMHALDERYIESIEARAEALAEAHPEDAALVRSYVDRQRTAAAVWEQNAVSATWLLRRVYNTVPRRMTTATTM
jgi:hypothetical protein